MHAHRLACRSCLVLVFLTEIPYPVPTQYLNLIPVIPRLSFYWYSYSYGRKGPRQRTFSQLQNDPDPEPYLVAVRSRSSRTPPSIRMRSNSCLASGSLPSKQYSGYLTVGQKHLHYWLVLSEDDLDNDPVTLWLNGGQDARALMATCTSRGVSCS